MKFMWVSRPHQHNLLLYHLLRASEFPRCEICLSGWIPERLPPLQRNIHTHTHVKTSFEAWGNLAQWATTEHNWLQQVFLRSLWLVSCDKMLLLVFAKVHRQAICYLWADGCIAGRINRDLQRVLQTLKHLLIWPWVWLLPQIENAMF